MNETSDKKKGRSLFIRDSHLPPGRRILRSADRTVDNIVLILLILMLIFHKKKAFNGECVCWFFGGYGLIRFVIEGIRTDRLLIPGTNLAVSQCLSLVFFIVSAVVIVVMRTRKMRERAEKVSAEAAGKTEEPASEKEE